MSQFEFLAVFISIVFGIAVTHIMAGVMRSFYRGERDTTQLVFSAFIFIVLVVNWWISFRWRDHEVWSLDVFMIIILWAMTHYVAAITLYPPLSAGVEQPFRYRRHWFLWAFIAVCVTDALQTWALGALFTPKSYLPFVGHYAVLGLLAVVIRKDFFYRWIGWYFLVSMISWAFIVRRFLE